MRGDQRRVDIQCQSLGRATQLPEPLARAGERDPDRLQQPWRRRDPVDHPKRCRVRRHLTEQRVLLTNRTEIRHALAAINEHHREIADHPARVMTATPTLDRGQPPRERPRESHLLRDLRNQRTARVRDQARSVRRDFYGYRASTTHHPQGEPPSPGSTTVSKPKDPRSAGRFRAPARRGRGRYCTLRAKQALANGYCGRALVQSCPHPNACLSCENFLTDSSFRHIHQQQLTHTQTLRERAQQNENTLLAELLDQDERSLRRILAGLVDPHRPTP
jgi:hypothetical protein